METIVCPAGYFTVSADKTTDYLNTAQLSICVRYVETSDQKDTAIRKMFLGVVAVHDLAGKSLAVEILNILRTVD